MSFGAPAMLLALLGVIVPIAIHLINRRRAQKVRFPALEFLLKSNQKLARRLKVKQVLLLAMRISIFLLIPLAMARPALDCSGAAGTTDGRLPTSVLLVIDDSASMSAPRGGGSAYEEALEEAEGIVRSLRSWDQVALVFSGDTADVAVPTFTDDRSSVLAALEDHTPRFGGGTLRDALAEARDIQATSRLPARRTIVLSDRAAHSWAADEELPVAGLGSLEWPDLGVSERNFAVSELSATRGTAGDYEVVATIQTFGVTEDVEIRANLLVDGDSVGAAVLAVAPGQDGVASFTHVFEGEGPFEIAVEVEDDDGAAADNIRRMPLHLRRSARVLVINGDARSVALNDEVFYLDRALAVGSEGRSDFQLERGAPDDLAAHSLDEFDVVVLANVGGLPAGQVERLVEFVGSGGGLLFTAGDNAVPDRWNSAFSSLLPRPIRSVKVLADRGDSDAAIKATRFGAFRPLHPAFRVFSAPGGQSLQAGLVYSYLLLEPQAEAEVEVVASFADGGPALLERSLGRGRVMLLTTSIDYDWSDLPVLTAYLPLVQRTVQYLGRRGASGSGQADIGARLSLDVGAFRTERVTVVSPSGVRRVLTTQTGSVGFTPTEAGLHQVLVEANGEEISASSLDFSASPPASEWPVGAIGVAELEAVSTAAREATDGRVQSEVQGTPLWPLALFLALLAVYAESLLAIRRRVWLRIRDRVRGNRAAASL